MADPISRINTELNTSWNTGVIAKPSYFSLRDQSYRPPNSIGGNYADAPEFDAAPGDTLHHRSWGFSYHLIANSDSDREKLLEEFLRIVRAYDHASIKWKCQRPHSFGTALGYKDCWIDGIEEDEVAVSAW